MGIGYIAVLLTGLLLVHSSLTGQIFQVLVLTAQYVKKVLLRQPKWNNTEQRDKNSQIVYQFWRLKTSLYEVPI